MSKKVRRYFLKEKESKNFLEKVLQKLKVSYEQIFKNKVKMEIVETGFAGIYLINGKPLLAKSGGNVFPTLVFHKFFVFAPKIVVDMGAIPHICNGADVMAPGIICFKGKFRKGDYVFVVDEKYGKPLAVGIIKYDANEVKNVKKGVVVKNLHFVGDKIWSSMKTLKLLTGESEN